MTKSPYQIRSAISDRIAAGHAAGGPGPERRARDQKLAAGFARDARMERLIAIRRDDPAAFARLPVELKMSVSYYENAAGGAGRLEGGRR